MRRTLVIALTAVLLGAVTSWLIPAQAQQPAPPPSWKQGQPASMADSMLAPIAQPPAPKAPGEIPIDKIKVPAGFKVELWASGINNARAMTWGDKGTLFVSSRVAGNVYAVVDKGGSREVNSFWMHCCTLVCRQLAKPCASGGSLAMICCWRHACSLAGSFRQATLPCTSGGSSARRSS